MLSPSNPSLPTQDEDAIAFARRVFGAARSGDLAGLSELLAHGLPPNLANENGDTLLMLASYHGHADLVTVLIAHGADPKRLNDRGQTPLAGAAFKGYDLVIQALIAGGAPVDHAGPDRRTALMVSAMFNRTELVRQLLAMGANPSQSDVTGSTAETIARAMGAAEAADVLSEAIRPAT